MVKHNNQVPNRHFHKAWKNRVKTWLDQPGRKKARRLARREKAAAIAPRPADGPLRPAVRCQTIRYNRRLRAGRGFTLDELREAGVNPKVAPTIGIAVDHRRHNKSVEGMQQNVQRLKSYMNKLVVFPRKGKVKQGDSKPEERKNATQVFGEVLPIRHELPTQPNFVKVTPELQKNEAFRTLRIERTNKRMAGKRAKRAAEEEALKK